MLNRDDGVRLWITLLWQLHPKGWNYQSKAYTYRYLFPENASSPPPSSVNPICTLFVAPKLKAIDHELKEYFPHVSIAIQEARIAIDLEMYFLSYGQFPKEINDLSPSNRKRPPLITYHPISKHQYLLTPSSNQAPSPLFSRDNNSHLVRMATGYWDLVWRFPQTKLENAE